LECFVGGLLALGSLHNQDTDTDVLKGYNDKSWSQAAADVTQAERITESCVKAYLDSPTGLSITRITRISLVITLRIIRIIFDNNPYRSTR